MLSAGGSLLTPVPTNCAGLLPAEVVGASRRTFGPIKASVQVALCVERERVVRRLVASEVGNERSDRRRQRGDGGGVEASERRRGVRRAPQVAGWIEGDSA